MSPDPIESLRTGYSAWKAKEVVISLMRSKPPRPIYSAAGLAYRPSRSGRPAGKQTGHKICIERMREEENSIISARDSTYIGIYL